MKRKRYETFCVILVIVSFLIIGFYTYTSYSNKKYSNDTKINNFYNADYLFNSGFLEVSKTIDDFSSKDKNIYIYLDASNVMYIKCVDNKDSINISGLPQGKITVYYNNLYDDYYEFLAKSENGDVYYLYIDLSKKQNYKFVLIGNNIKNVYVPSYDKKMVFVNKTNRFITNFVLLDDDKNIKYIDYDEDYVLKNDLNKKKPYFDYVCAVDNSLLCNEMMVYITFNNEIIYKNNVLKDLSGNVIYVRDMFSTFEILSNENVDLTKISFSDLRKYDYIFELYVVDKSEVLHKITLSNDDIKVNDFSSKVKQVQYNGSVLEIIFDNNKYEKIKNSSNKLIGTSTIYDKNSKNTVTLPIK